MTAVVGGLLASLLQGDELVAKIDVRTFLVFCPELEFKETPIKGQCLDVSIHFQTMWFRPIARGSADSVIGLS
jgi:hypothetical protein